MFSHTFWGSPRYFDHGWRLFVTTKKIIFRFLAKKVPFFAGGPFLGFRSTPTSYRLVPKIARRDRFKNDKIGPKGGFPRKIFDPVLDDLLGSKGVTFLVGGVTKIFFSSFSVGRTRRVASKSVSKLKNWWTMSVPTTRGASPPPRKNMIICPKKVVNGSPIEEMKISDKNQIFWKIVLEFQFFSKKVDGIRENITTSFGDLSLTFYPDTWI